MNCLVVNCSHPSYNLGLSKLANWLAAQGHTVSVYDGGYAELKRNEKPEDQWLRTGLRVGEPLQPLALVGYDRVCLSTIFSWHVNRAVEVARIVKDCSEVWVGGPAMNHNHKAFTAETGIEVPFFLRDGVPVYGGPDARFDQQRGDYRMIYAMRGCPVGCSFCPVWQIEGKEFVLDRNFQPAKMLCDNNLSGPEVEMQEFIIRRYVETGVPLQDANSGFEPKSFDEGTFKRWSPIMRGAWRFALDETEETEDVHRMLGILKDVPGRKKRVYCLLGYEPMEQCLERARKILEWGAEPFCQVFIPLNYRHDPEKLPPPPRHDWTTARLPYDARRYFNSPQIWRSYTLQEYDPRPGSARPFLEIA